MWERFSYYGMRALLVLFMVQAVAKGGLGFTDRTATAIYGLYTGAVYLAALPGGWVADRLLGPSNCVWFGGILIACGHFTLAIPYQQTFFLGLLLVVLGTGLLKPNVTALVGRLYSDAGARRDAGFSIFYMGINLGALLGPLVCSALGEKINWHYGFAAAGIGMLFGLLQFRLSPHFRSKNSSSDSQTSALSVTPNFRLRTSYLPIIIVAFLALVVGLTLTGIIHINPIALASVSQYVIAGIGALYFAAVFLFFGLSAPEKKRVTAILLLLIAAAIFWAGLEQAGSSLNLFAERYTVRTILGVTVPAGWFQALPALFVICLAPMAAATWVTLARRGTDPSVPVKFGYGLLLLSAGFVVMALASRFVANGRQVWPTWLISTYLLHTVGELCLSPIGLSSVTKLAPARIASQMLGAWFLATSLGNLMAGLLAGLFSGEAVGQMSARYLQIVMLTAVTGMAILLCAKPIKKLMRS